MSDPHLITDGFPRGLGYHEIDERASGGGHFEADTYTCSHCQFVVVKHPLRVRERYKCSSCQHHICDGCAAVRVGQTGPCKTFNQLAEESIEAVLKRPDSLLILP